MRAFLLSFPARLQVFIVTGATMASAFAIATFISLFFDVGHLKANTDLISSVYQVMGTIYAILLTFTLWGVWQAYTNAEAAVQKESYALLDLVHVFESSPRWEHFGIRKAALKYLEGVIQQEWSLLKDMTSSVINLREQSHFTTVEIVQAVQNINPEGEREFTVFAQALRIMENWMDARRTRILTAYGNTAKALWPLLLIGALVLFAFHGLFVAETLGIWVALLAGTSLVIGLTFYLIFTLDCPFAGVPSIDSAAKYGSYAKSPVLIDLIYQPNHPVLILIDARFSARRFAWFSR